jgi:hypothetical protein
MRRAVKDLGAEGELWELGRVTEQYFDCVNGMFVRDQ